ncbi:P-loop containing nucleoside triphosphate hydrolase protein [Auriscalpium vulgare]|uniref:P-loop containing nucleoside triphosphate hydrolase protein n=1 Tax=Auriscalpium vulgare TaxID=40419 RepID=A0ACB8RYN3_9AGAM|nr:P-loop containing nucleoside triphosphate hydrolase protein [Auriscalpium vulgare]
MVNICPQLLATGSCQDETCAFKHDVLFCEPCQLVLISQAAYASHVKGKKHQRNVSGAGKMHHCPICNVPVPPGQGWQLHLRGKRHELLAQQGGVSSDVQPEAVPVRAGEVLCELCDVVVTAERWERHTNQRTHKSKEKYAAYKAVFDDASKDKNGVSLSHGGGIDYGVVELPEAIRGVMVQLTIKTAVPLSTIRIVQIRLSSSLSRLPQTSGFAVSAPDSGSLRLQYGRETRLGITLRHDHRGRFEDRLEITFEDTTLKQKFIIVRLLKATVGSKADYELLKPSRPYVPRQRTARQAEVDVVPGPSAPALEAVKWVVSLPHAPIPQSISSVLFSGSTSDVIRQLRRTVLPASLNKDTYGRHFKTLLWIEEGRMERDLQTYDIDDARLTRHNQYYYLEVPGLAEKRPSVLTGDRILVQRHGAATGKWFEGHVHTVRKEEVGLRFHGSFPIPSADQLHNVHFKLNRTPLRRQHQALDTAFIERRVLFPTQQHVDGMVPSNVSMMNFYNGLLAGNAPQRAAVSAIVRLPPGSVPFVIFGPPGTGKTITTIEAIRQVLRTKPNARILACAPSNSAADLLASRLAMLGPDQLFRHYAPSRFKDTVPDELLQFTCTNSQGHFTLPPIAVLKRYKVIVSTCVSASFAHNIGLPRGHFSHIFVDEAGQATEPEVMIAIKTMADPSTNVVLSGDPKQLGPIIRSAIARRLQLDVSYMERLMNLESDIYDEDDGHGTTIVKLTQNYRSHPAILTFPNERFYNGDLEPCADARVMNSYLGSPVLPSPKFPIVFHGMTGKDAREASSPSFFNIEEAQQVKAYVEALRSDRRFRITDKEIGIIAPYHAQCVKIRTLLRSFAEGIKVGSTEEFQGQERRVIIISTVRSSRDFVEYDLRHTLGFVANPRRFNVAVTRAQALLIVVGDPSVLSLDPLWRSFLNYIYNNGGWKGAPISWDPEEDVDESGGYDAGVRAQGVAEMNSFAERMEALTLQGVAAADEEADVNVDRPWRDVE